MPRYALSDQEMAILAHYLGSLSKEPSPGVDAATLRFATIVGEGVPARHRDAMLGVLQTHIDAHNAQYRHQARRATSGPFFQTEMNLRHRRLELERWDLTGPPESWRGQLEAHARRRPVFALLGGIAMGPWQPIHDFCEDNRIPCLFPITDLPAVSTTDWYTHYFSKGLYQEGEATAAYLRHAAPAGSDTQVVQVFRRNERTAALTRGLRETATRLDLPAPIDRPLAPGEAFTDQLWKELADGRPTILLLWLDGQDLAALDGLAQARSSPRVIFLSSTLLGEGVSRVPDSLRQVVYLTYPYSLPGETKLRRTALEKYLRTRRIAVTHLPIQARMSFLGGMLSRVLGDIRSEFFRDYFLEKLEMMADQQTNVAVYPELTFGPGQRYASKGCYIVRLTPGPNPELVKESDWVTH
jgi:hypothetical protein